MSVNQGRIYGGNYLQMVSNSVNQPKIINLNIKIIVM